MNNWQWTYTEANDSKGVQNFGDMIIRADREVKNGGNASLKISGCNPVELPNVFPSLVTKVTLNTQNKYRFEIDAKAETDGPVRIKLQESNFQGWSGNDGVKEIINARSDVNKGYKSDWTHYSFMLDTRPYTDPQHKTEYDQTILLSITNLVGDLWLDNAALYAVDADDDLIDGVNLLGDGNMEFADYTVEAATFKQANEAVDHTVPGKIDISTKISNYAKGDNFNVAVFTAVYDDNKKLVFAEKSQQKTVIEKPEYLTGEVFTSSVTLDNANQTVKVVYWDGNDLITPIANNAVLAPLQATN